MYSLAAVVFWCSGVGGSSITTSPLPSCLFCCTSQYPAEKHADPPDPPITHTLQCYTSFRLSGMNKNLIPPCRPQGRFPPPTNALPATTRRGSEGAAGSGWTKKTTTDARSESLNISDSLQNDGQMFRVGGGDFSPCAATRPQSSAVHDLLQENRSKNNNKKKNLCENTRLLKYLPDGFSRRRRRRRDFYLRYSRVDLQVVKQTKLAVDLFFFFF